MCGKNLHMGNDGCGRNMMFIGCRESFVWSIGMTKYINNKVLNVFLEKLLKCCIKMPKGYAYCFSTGKRL